MEKEGDRSDIEKGDRSINIDGLLTNSPIASGEFHESVTYNYSDSPKSTSQEWYHVSIITKDDSGNELRLHKFNLSESGIKRGITLPMSQGKNF
jgi:hypothetical protein